MTVVGIVEHLGRNHQRYARTYISISTAYLLGRTLTPDVVAFFVPLVVLLRLSCGGWRVHSLQQLQRVVGLHTRGCAAARFCSHIGAAAASVAERKVLAAFATVA